MGEKTNRREPFILFLFFRSVATNRYIAVIDPIYGPARVVPRSCNILFYSVLQWEFHPCGAGFIVSSVFNSDLFLAVRDWKELHLEGATEVVTENIPTCWEVEVMNNGNESRDAEDGEDDEKGDVYVR